MSLNILPIGDANKFTPFQNKQLIIAEVVIQRMKKLMFDGDSLTVARQKCGIDRNNVPDSITSHPEYMKIKSIYNVYFRTKQSNFKFQFQSFKDAYERLTKR